jgi:hypothetical protein
MYRGVPDGVLHERFPCQNHPEPTEPYPKAKLKINTIDKEIFAKIANRAKCI